MVRNVCRIFAAIIVASFLLPSSASAQITTGTVTGRVADSTGAVVAGAHVVLISETRGTEAPQSPPTTRGTTCSRISPATRTPSRSPPRRSRPRGRGSRYRRRSRRRPPLTLEVGGTTETVTVTAEATLVQTGAVSALAIEKHRSKTCRSATRTSRMRWPLLRA